MARLRIGILAPEFPPAIGGMHTLAWGMADALSRTDDITVVVREDNRQRQGAHFEQRHVLSGNMRADLARLAGEEVDLWLALNGGLTPLARWLNRPFFVYLHGSDFLMPWITYGSRWLEPLRRPYLGNLKRTLRRGAIRRSIGATRHVFVNSRRTGDLACETLGIGGDRITVCPPGVDDTFFQSRAESPHGEAGTFEVVTVTRLTQHSARKNVDGVLAAVAQLSGDLAVHYTVVGDGDDRPRLESLARELGISKLVTFTGRLADDELLACYRRANLFVMASRASRYDVEGFGIVYIEASASGVPVICSAEGGATDAVAEGVNGIVIRDSSPASIAEGIRRIVANRDRFAPDRVRSFAEGYRWPKIAALLRGVLVQHLERPQRRAAA